MNLNLEIARLVLDGFSLLPSEQVILQHALEAELVRLLGSGGLRPDLAAGGSLAFIPGGLIQVAPATSPDGLGRQIAGAVYAGLGDGGKTTDGSH
jgi:hypothetical protein